MRITFSLTCPHCKTPFGTRRLLNNKSIAEDKDPGAPIAMAIADVMRNTLSGFNAHMKTCEKRGEHANLSKVQRRRRQDSRVPVQSGQELTLSC